jgi:hypothetical protein
MMRSIFTIALLGSMLGASVAAADPWKDESGHGKHWKEKSWKHWKEGRGETPWWERGKGYWDGHFKHGRAPHYYTPRTYGFYPPAPYDYYVPTAPDAYYYDYYDHQWQPPYVETPPAPWSY